jgi:glucokinase
MTGAATIGIDVGGTAIKLGVVDTDGRVLARRRFAYAAMTSFDAIVAALVVASRELEREAGRNASALGSIGADAGLIAAAAWAARRA